MKKYIKSQFQQSQNPAKEIDVGEVYDAFIYQEPMRLEAMGLCEDGKAGLHLEKRVFLLNGRLPVNPSGGLLSGHPVIPAGLIRLSEIVKQLRGESGKDQVSGARVGIAHGVNGLCGQSRCLWILDQ